MKAHDLITDEAINIVFKNTSFGYPSREVIAKKLPQIKKGYHIGYTAQCCLLELGLIYKKSYKAYGITPIGEKYLEIISIQEKCTHEYIKRENGIYECLDCGLRNF